MEQQNIINQVNFYGSFVLLHYMSVRSASLGEMDQSCNHHVTDFLTICWIDLPV